MKNRKKIFVLMAAAFMLFAGCKPAVTPGNSGGKEDNPIINTPTYRDPVRLPVNFVSSESIGNRAKSLDFIFNTNSVGKVTITMRRSEWNQMLKNYDYFYKNENCVKFTEFEYEKDGEKWNLKKGGGIRLRGNTSRFRPQGKDSPEDKTGHHQMNADWSQDYYNYAKTCSDNDYRQSHFKVDFEEFLEGDDEQKLAGCMKGVALKRMDGSCTKEIFCYDLFHRYGIWTAPRASHTRVFFNFIEDIESDGSVYDDISDCTVTEVNYGVYEMFEEVNKQSLKGREKDQISGQSVWKNNKGNLWKCAGGDLTNPNVTMYAEQVEITEFDENGNPKAFVWNSPTYDLKTNKDNVEGAAAELKQFITELNALPNVANKDDSASIDAIKAFYEKWMDVDFFLKTYAVNILVGMDDDYWSNANNYYLYFGDAKDGSRKVYFIPFDYDNTLGASIKGDHSKGEKEGIEQNPLEWGRGANRPLMDKLLQVPEYKQLFKDLLIEVSSADNEWNYEKCSDRWNKYWNMVDPYLNSPDLSDQICTKSHWDNTYKPKKSLVYRDNNLYDYTRECIVGNIILDSGGTVTADFNEGYIFDSGSYISGEKEFEITDSKLSLIIPMPVKEGYVFAGWTKTKDGNDYVNLSTESKVYASWKTRGEINQTYIYEPHINDLPALCIAGPENIQEGMYIEILNVPEWAKIRSVYVNGVEVASGEDKYAKESEWWYPYVREGEKYSVYVIYREGWGGNDRTLQTETITIVADSGLGNNYVENVPVSHIVTNNQLVWKSQPTVYVQDMEVTNSFKPGDFVTDYQEHAGAWKWFGQHYDHEYYLPDYDIKESMQQYFEDSKSWNKNTIDDMKASGNIIGIAVIYKLPMKIQDHYGEYRIPIALNGDLFGIE